MRMLLLVALGLLAATIAMTPGGIGQAGFVAAYYAALGMLSATPRVRRRSVPAVLRLRAAAPRA
jgi:hypothetical protein